VKKITLAVFFSAALLALPTFSQEKPKPEPVKAPAAPPLVDPLLFTDAEKREVAPLLQEQQALTAEKSEAETKLLTIPNGDASAFEARARELKDILTRLGSWQQRSQAWLLSVRQRAACPDCFPNFQTGRLVRPEPAK
jgi:hypothetical protein